MKRGPGLLDDALNVVDSIVITKVFNFLPLTAFQVFHQVRVDIVENFNDDRQNEIRSSLLKILSFETSKPEVFRCRPQLVYAKSSRKRRSILCQYSN